MLFKKYRYINCYNTKTGSINIITKKRYSRESKFDMCSMCILKFIIPINDNVKVYKCRFLRKLPNYDPLDEVCVSSQNYVYIPKSIT